MAAPQRAYKKPAANACCVFSDVSVSTRSARIKRHIAISGPTNKRFI